MTLPYSKLLDPSDYEREEMKWAQSMLKHTSEELEKKGLLDPLPHPHRMWEYGMALLAAKRFTTPSSEVLEVGGSTSLLGPTLIKRVGQLWAMESPEWETEATLYRRRAQMGENAHRLGGIDTWPIGKVWSPFPLVICISVIEHVEDEETFLQNLWRCVAPGGALFLTTDVGLAEPDLFMFSWMRSRIYTPEKLFQLPSRLKGADWAGPMINFEWTGAHLYDSYNFGCVYLRKAP